MAFLAIAALATTLHVLPAKAEMQCRAPSAEREPYTSIQTNVASIFLDRPKTLLERGSVSQQFFEDVKSLELYVCEDNNYEAFTNGSYVRIDVSLIDAMFYHSWALTVGQYINYRDSSIPATALLEEFIRTAIAQLEDPNARKVPIQEVVQKVTNGRKSLSQPPSERNLSSDVSGIFVQALGFVFLHEMCHVSLDHLEKINGMKELSASERETLELNADRCALAIVNQDEEATGGQPGASFIGFTTAAATQQIMETFFDQHLGADRVRTHPLPADRVTWLAEATIAEQKRRKASDPRFGSTVSALTDFFHGLQKDLAKPSQ